MNIGFMKDMLLSKARELFLFDCKVAGVDADTLFAYREVLDKFIQYTGDLRVEHLKPDHVRAYIANLSDRLGTKRGHRYILRKHYAVVRMLVQWLYAQKALTEPGNSPKAPRKRRGA